MVLTWDNFSLAEWDAFTLTEWDTFILQGGQYDPTDYYIEASMVFVAPFAGMVVVPQIAATVFAAGSEKSSSHI